MEECHRYYKGSWPSKGPQYINRQSACEGRQWGKRCLRKDSGGASVLIGVINKYIFIHIGTALSGTDWNPVYFHHEKSRVGEGERQLLTSVQQLSDIKANFLWDNWPMVPGWARNSKTLSASQDTGKSCRKENQTLLHWVSSLWRTLLGSLTGGPSQLHLKDTGKRSTLSKQSQNKTEKPGGKRTLCSQFTFPTTQTGFYSLLSDCFQRPWRSLLTELMEFWTSQVLTVLKDLFILL